MDDFVPRTGASVCSSITSDSTPTVSEDRGLVVGQRWRCSDFTSDGRTVSNEAKRNPLLVASINTQNRHVNAVRRNLKQSGSLGLWNKIKPSSSRPVTWDDKPPSFVFTRSLGSTRGTTMIIRRTQGYKTNDESGMNDVRPVRIRLVEDYNKTSFLYLPRKSSVANTAQNSIIKATVRENKIKKMHPLNRKGRTGVEMEISSKKRYPESLVHISDAARELTLKGCSLESPNAVSEPTNSKPSPNAPTSSVSSGSVDFTTTDDMGLHSSDAELVNSTFFF